MSRILIIDDEPQIRRFLRISLVSQGYEVVEAETGEAGLTSAGLENPQLIILDLGLPDREGHEVLKILREFFEGPIIVLSVRYRETEKVRALDAGANDYVVKPFGIQELLARIRSLLKLFEGVENIPAMYSDGNLTIDLINRRVAIQGSEIRLSRKEFELLRMLMSHPGRIVTQQQLLQQIWGPTHKEDTHYLRIFVAKLRSKLKDNPTEPRYIETEPGVGYRFLGDNRYT
jgi:two-component system KDP operon response regulator KdpE